MTRNARLRAAVAIVGTLGALSAVSGASGAKPTENPDQPSLNGVPADATPYVAPGDTTVGMRKGNHIYYDGGATIVTLKLAAAWDCTSGYFCLFDGYDGSGTRVQYSSAGGYIYLGSFDNRANSWRNRRSSGTYIDENTNGGTGWRVCANPGQAANLAASQINEASNIFNRLSGNC